MNKKVATNHPCFECLRETEIKVNDGSWKKLPKPFSYWYEMCYAESEELKKFLIKFKPKTILEVGCGSGRIINIILGVDYPKKIYAVDKDKKMVDIVKPFFKKDKIQIINADIDNFLNDSNKKFDLVVCMMNTLGNIGDLNVLKKIADNSKNFIFTLYDEKYYRLREEIYRSKGHRKFNVKNKTYIFDDPWVKGLKSKSYSEKEVEEICNYVGKKFKIKKISKLLFMIHIYD